MLERGYWTVGRIAGLSVRLHWTLPFGLLAFAGFRWSPGAWLGIFALILAHELGHAALVKRRGLTNLGIDLTGYGGRCRFAGAPSARDAAVIAWGGVLAQLVILLGAVAALFAFGVPRHPLAADLAYALTYSNAMLIAINLLPIRPLDGAEAWSLLRTKRDPTLREALREADRHPPP